MDGLTVVDEDQDNHKQNWFVKLVNKLFHVPHDDNDHCWENLEINHGTYNDDLGEKYIFITEEKRLLQLKKSKCHYNLASDVRKVKNDPNSKMYLYNQYCFNNSKPNISCIGQDTENENGTKKKTIIVLGSTITSTLAISVIIIVTVCLLKKGILCDKNKAANENAIVHQNDLYGNISNQDYFDERYDTNIVDKNENYQQYGEY